MIRFATKALVLGVLLALTITAPVAAQQAEEVGSTEPGEAPETAEQQVFGEEVTVTARKREETAQEVPISLVAQTEEELRKRGADDLEDVSANVAGFTIQNLGPGQSQVAIRGVSAGQVVRDQPGVKEQVGVYLDETVLSMSLFTPDIDLFDMSRVEVLRGPQGTLFGSGSLSGTVRYITNQPEIGVSEEFGEVTFDAVDDGGLGGSLKAAANVPLGDTAAMRITAWHNERGGFIDAVQPGLSMDDDVNSGTRTGLRWAFRFEPNERLTLTPRIIYQEVESDGWNRVDIYNILANPFTTTRPAVDLGEREQFIQIAEPFSDEFLLADLTLDYSLGDLLLTSITSYTDRDILVVRDAGALTSSITGGSIGLPEEVYTLDAPLDDATVVEMLTQEVRLAGASDRLDWLVGLFYTDMERAYGQDLLVDGFEALSGIPTEGLRAPRDVLFFSDLDYDFEQLALFGELTYAVSDRLDITAGLRLYDFEESRTQVFDGIFGNDDNGNSLVSTEGQVSADGLAPRAIASYELNDTTELNFQVSKGFRLGGINDPLNVPLCTPEDLATFGGRETWDDEVLWNYEVGTKSSILGGRGTFNLAAFHMDISDLQATVTAGSCSSRVVFNVPDATSQGIELEVAAATSEHFDFAVSASFNESELDSTLTSTDAEGNVSVVSGIQEGNRLPTVPEFQAAAAATWQWHMPKSRLGSFTATYQHVGSRFTQIGDQAESFGTVDLLALPFTIGGPLTQDTFTFDPELPAYDILNLRLGIVARGWEAALFVHNVTDEVAHLALDQERGTLARVGLLTNPPRTVGLMARIDF